MARKKQYWLVKSEPDVYSIDDLERDGQTYWEGVRNYQARNSMRDGMRVGDRVLYYHSNAKPPAIAGIAQVVKEAYPDFTQFDPENPYYDPKSSPENPRWLMVDIGFVAKLPRALPLDELKDNPDLAGMPLLQKGQRLSVLPVEEKHYRLVCRLAGVKG